MFGMYAPRGIKVGTKMRTAVCLWCPQLSVYGSRSNQDISHSSLEGVLLKLVALPKEGVTARQKKNECCILPLDVTNLISPKIIQDFIQNVIDFFFLHK